jgi:hypothetical protein
MHSRPLLECLRKIIVADRPVGECSVRLVEEPGIRGQCDQRKDGGSPTETRMLVRYWIDHPDHF